MSESIQGKNDATIGSQLQNSSDTPTTEREAWFSIPSHLVEKVEIDPKAWFFPPVKIADDGTVTMDLPQPDTTPQPDQPAKKWPGPRDVTGETPRQKSMREKSAEIDRALGIDAADFSPTNNGGFVQRGEGFFILGMGDSEAAPPADAEEDGEQEGAEK
jgi:hypothetical protein